MTAFQRHLICAIERIAVNWCRYYTSLLYHYCHGDRVLISVFGMFLNRSHKHMRYSIKFVIFRVFFFFISLRHLILLFFSTYCVFINRFNFMILFSVFFLHFKKTKRYVEIIGQDDPLLIRSSLRHYNMVTSQYLYICFSSVMVALEFLFLC